jgi:hypothetical protein
MLVVNKREFTKGILLAISFLIVLFIMFMPLFGGENALRAADRLFNSISKGSTNYIADLEKKNKAFEATPVAVSIKFQRPEVLQQATKLMSSAGVQATVQGDTMKIDGKLGVLTGAAIKDSEAMFNNRDSELQTRYGFSGRHALYTWWTIFKRMDVELKKQGKFKEAAFIDTVVKRGVEVGYNYFGIEPQSARSKAGILTFSLIFYVIYTLWWGIAVLFIFEGVGLEMKAGAKKEM